MRLKIRNYQNEDDFWRIHTFLRQVFMFNGRQELCWQTYRFDYWRWHGIENLGQGPLLEKVFIWETESGEIGVVLNPENPGHVHLQIHPVFRTPDFDEEILVVAEKHLSVQQDGQKKLFVWANDQDDQISNILAQRGYRKLSGYSEYKRFRPLCMPIPEKPVAEGYVVRSLGDVEELPARSWASWRGFHPDDPLENYEGWEWYRNIQRAPLYRRDLDLVAVAPGGEIASFCTIWFDDVTRTGAFEPVATAPEHLRLGLASAVMREGLRRMKRMGATQATVGSYNEPAHSLYASLGFTDYIVASAWEKNIMIG